MLSASILEPGGCRVADAALGVTALFRPNLCGGGRMTCSEDLLKAASSPDGTLWFLASSIETQGMNVTTFHLGHIAADGTLLGIVDFPPQGYGTMTTASLVVDDQGLARVALYTSYAANADSDLVEATTLHSYLPDMTPRGAPVTLTGFAMPRLAIDPQGDYVIAGNAMGQKERGVLGHLTGEGALEQSNNKIPTRGSRGQGIVALTASGAGYGLLAEAVDSKDTAPEFRVLTFGADLGSQWAMPLPSPLATGFSANMVSDSQGRLVVAATLGALSPVNLGIYGYDPDGHQRFSLTHPYSLFLPAPIMAASRREARVWIVSESQTPTVHQVLAEVDVESGECIAHEVAPNQERFTLSLRNLVVTNDETIILVSQFGLFRLDKLAETPQPL